MGSGSKKRKHGRGSRSPSRDDERRRDKDRRDRERASSSSTSHRHKDQASSSKRKRSSSPEEFERSRQRPVKVDSDDDEEEDFSFEKYKYELNMIFFRDGDLIKQGTDEYKDFWDFLRNYLASQKKLGKKYQPARESRLDPDLGIPVEFDKSHIISIGLKAKMDELMSRMPPRDRSTGRWLSQKRIAEFRDIFLMYLDFKQKEKFKKLKALREGQTNLPVAHYRKEIVEAVQENSVVVIAGDTGCGKSTQVPQYLIRAGFKNIACTQPRRIACISLSKRVAYETLNQYGSEVGYQIRFEKSKTQHTKILFITEGLLLRQVQTDPELSGYDVIVLDEVHERHLHGDFMLGILKCLLFQRKDLKLVLMSATINIQLFAGFFEEFNPKVIQVPGRLFPIKLHYRPIVRDRFAKKSERFDPHPFVQILQLIDKKYPKDEKGDVLMFLSGMTEISTVVEAGKLYAQETQNWIILPLHSTLSISDQDKVFDYPPDGVRKCIVSTNIAETSVTIDGIRFVVDSGKVKEMSYDATCKMQRLKEFWVSQASAEQRKGRAGRTGPGVCFRLFSEEEYEAMSPYTTPEILRVPLDSLLLQMVAMGLPDARRFPFIEAPAAESIEQSIGTLKEQGALTVDEHLTPMGKMLSCLPVDITIGKMLILGSMFHQVEPILSLAAALSVQNPFTNKAYRDPDCENSRKELESDHGDPLTLLNAFREWLEVKQENNDNPGHSTRWCKRRGLEEQRFYEMTKLRRQFKELLQESRLLYSAEEEKKMTSSERIQRHGELQLLRKMKREHRNEEPRKRSVLKLDPWGLQESGAAGMEEEGGKIDIKDVEFRLGNDRTQLRKLLTGTKTSGLRDLMMLKIITGSGLYPQVAVADEFNHSKSAPEQMFHTRNKPFAMLHPMGFFANHPTELHLSESDIDYPPGFTTKQPVSSKHQLLMYMTLLETTKPYLTGTMRMPAAQTLLLFASSIDTNFDFTRVVCDSWLQIRFATPETAQVLVSRVAKLRAKWERLIALKLEDTKIEENDEKEKTSSKSSNEARQLEAEVSIDLISFMMTEVFYAIQRLLAADIKVLYVGEGSNECPVDPNPLQEDFEAIPDKKKGGMRLTPNITYNCLTDTGDTSWTGVKAMFCPNCNLPLSVLPIERMSHEMICKSKEEQDAAEAETKKEVTCPPPGSEKYPAYECPDCKETLYLPPVEILRHKRRHLK
ncbi:probable ATP-dependent RNA helicase DHX34 [Neocloeon triangulifer]|uniref:probable ATP-dependent RNA helicase DHX34 n=1 Tax=Neocloeon triangulifer TaxID=2078957 RepID=UPI00286F799E|nr:probable ATP-dependent RNA helicase DHX34 [Neocloeon triangulifer]